MKIVVIEKVSGDILVKILKFVKSKVKFIYNYSKYIGVGC